MFTDLSQGWLYAKFGCFVIQVIPTPCIFAWSGLSAMSNLDVLVRDLLCSWGYFSLSISSAFLGGGSELFGEFFSHSHKIWLVCTVKYFWGSPFLVPGLQQSGWSSGSASFGLLIIPKLQVIPTPCIFAWSGLSAMSNLDVLVRDLLCSWGYFSLSISSAFLGGGSELFGEFFSHSHKIWLVCTVKYFWGSPFLVPGLQQSGCSSGGASFGIWIILKFPILLEVFQIIWKDRSATTGNVPVIILPDLWFPCFVTDKFLTGCFPSLWWAS